MDAEAAVAFADRMLELLWAGESIDGCDIQETAVECGLIAEVPGGFDPSKHCDPSGVCRPGDSFFQIVKANKGGRDDG